MKSIPLTLYVHMPWCVRKCPYCDFNSHQLKSALPGKAYIGALLRDFERELERVPGRTIECVFFGGGTPSLFAPEDLAHFLAQVRSRADLRSDAEITLEANPGTIERGRFAGYAEAGINRVSLGAQSFDPGSLQRLGRIHSPEDTERAVGELQAAGLRNFNLDMMYALPGQSVEEALQDVRHACSLGPAHISFYQLTLEAGTVFYSRPPSLPDDETAWRMQTEGQELLAKAGYEQYEVSAYARSGTRCKHNLNYWLFGDYIGIGAGAHGKLSLSVPGQILRTVKPKQPGEYQALAMRDSAGGDNDSSGTEALGECHVVAARDLPFEFMLNALRLNEGCSDDCFEQRTGLPADSLAAKIQEVRRRGLLDVHPGGWQPSELGRRFLNDLQAAFLP